MAFITPAALPSRQQATSARCARRAPRMAAGQSDKKESLADWLYGKFMHNALWEGDQEAGYEPFFKEAMKNREEEQAKAYAEKEKDSN